MTLWTESDQIRWQAVRARGALRFVLIRGLLVFGGFMFVARGLLGLLFEGNASRFSIDGALWSVFVGLAWGIGVWLWSEHLYRGGQGT